MTCRDLADFLDAYLGGDLPDPVREEFERHLRVCPPCRAYLGGYRGTVGLLRGGGDDDARAVVPDALVRAVLAARRAGRKAPCARPPGESGPVGG